MISIRRCALLLTFLSLAGIAHGAPTITYFRMRGVFTGGIAAGPDGKLWVPTSSGIVTMTPPSGDMTLHPTPDGVPDIIAGPDGRMWHTVYLKSRIGAMTTAGVDTEYPLAAGISVSKLAAGADGAIWFGYFSTSNRGVGRITTSGEVTYYQVAAPAQVRDLELGPDGNIWFAEYPLNRIGRITPAGVITHFETYPAACCGPVSIARGADGELWLAFNSSRAIAHVLMNGTLEVVYPVGTGSSYDGRPMTVQSGPDARIWFTTELSKQIGRLNTDGSVELFDMPSDVSAVLGAVAGPDGNLWATLQPPAYGCIWECPPPAPTLPPLAVARINLIAPASTSIPTMSGVALAIMVVALAAIAMFATR